MILSVTGYVGTGKSTVAGFFAQHGFAVIDVDTLAHGLLNDKGIKDQILAEFGLKILTRNLEIDRQKLREIVFHDDQKVKILDKIMHPKLKSSLDKTVSANNTDMVLDVALNNELDVKKLCDKTILVRADLQQVFDRLNPRFSKYEIISMMNNQDITSSADFVIINNGTRENLNAKVEKIVNEIK